MLDRFDDYPIHQTPEPIRHPATGDRNAYDRYFFNGYTRSGDLFFAVALGLYPNRRVMDASVSVVFDGKQYALHASRVAPDDRGETRVGPISIEVVEPMQELRIRVEPNAHPIECDLRFRARTPAVEEPRFQRRSGTRVVMDSTRFAQFGTWEGRLRVGGTDHTLQTGDTFGSRDRSWGVRGVGEREAGAPAADPPQFYWLWAPVNFDGCCTHFGINEDAAGDAWHQNGCIVPLIGSGGPTDPSGIERADEIQQEIRWRPGTRRIDHMRLVFARRNGRDRVIELEPLFEFQMLGIGYLHPEWGHGVYKGDDALAFESYTLADLDPLQPQHLHVQALCRATLDGKPGIGVLEQLVIGPHAPSGFKDFLDGAS